jgi:hypothetical protein
MGTQSRVASVAPTQKDLDATPVMGQMHPSVSAATSAEQVLPMRTRWTSAAASALA